MIKKRRDAIAQEDVLFFFQQLSCLISAGTTLLQGLTLLLQTQEKKAYRALILTLCHELENGKAFNHALQRFPQYFDALICHFVHIGEQTGTLGLMLERVCAYVEKKHALYNQLKQALIYPFILIIAALITTLMMLYYIVPQFTELFSQLPNSLPFMTRFIVHLSQLLHHTGPWIILLFVCSVLILIPPTTIRLHHWQQPLLKLPLLGEIIKKIMLARLTRNLSTILSAAIPLTEALILIASLFRHTGLRDSIHALYTEVNAGKRFYAALAINPFFPPLLIQMIRTGEESGTLERMLEKFADIIEADIQRSLKTLSHILEPLIITIVGVLIGGTVIAMYLPLFQLGSLI